jgi:hypothetical protein
MPFKSAAATYCLGWIAQNRASNAIGSALAARVGALTWRQAQWISITNPESLCGAIHTVFGTVGRARSADQDAHLELIAEWFSRLLDNVLSTKMAELDEALEYRQVLRLERERRAARTFTHGLPAASLPSPPAAWRIGVSHYARVAVGSILKVASWGLACSVPLILGFQDHFLIGYTGIGRLVAIGSVWGCCRILATGARMLMPGNAWHGVQRHDGEFVLYLRSFIADSIRSYAPRVLLPQVFLPLRSPEEDVVDALRPIGPVLAVAQPSGMVPFPGGAARFKTDGVRWESVVVALMERARLIVVVPSVTKGLRRELSWVRQCVPPEKLILYFPDELWRRALRQEAGFASADDVRDVLLACLGVDVGKLFGDLHFLWFRKGWNATRLHSFAEFRDLDGGRTPELRCALSPAYAWFDVRPPARVNTFLLARLLFAGIAIWLFSRWLPALFHAAHPYVGLHPSH